MPMKDNRVHEMGPPKETSKAIIALSTTREGPSAVMALLLMASFICSAGADPFQGPWS